MTCPECGSKTVTVELGPDISPLSTITEAVVNADEGDAILMARDCWECGWRETRRLQLAAIEVEPGDETVQRRRQLIDEVNTELADIQSIASLRDALAEVKHVRRLEPSGVEGEE